MATHTGLAGTVKVGSDAISEIVSFSVDETNDTVEASNLTSTAKVYKALRKDATGTIECHWDETDTNGQEALDVGSEVTLNLYPEGADSGDAYYTGTAIITGASVSVTLDGIISRSFTVQFTGGLTHTTV
jgi:hypothetical protein